MSTSSFDFLDLAAFFGPTLPLLLVWCAGMVLALVRWRRHPTVSLLAMIALALLSVNLVVGNFFVFWLPRMRGDLGWSNMSLGQYFSIMAIVRTTVSAVGWILLLIALYGWRNPPVRIIVDRGPEEPGRPPDTGIRQ